MKTIKNYLVICCYTILLSCFASQALGQSQEEVSRTMAPVLEIVESGELCARKIAWRSVEVTYFDLYVIAQYSRGENTYTHTLDRTFYFTGSNTSFLNYNLQNVLNTLSQNEQYFSATIIIAGLDADGNTIPNLTPLVIPFDHCGSSTNRRIKNQVIILEAIAQVMPPDALIDCNCNQYALFSEDYFSCMARCGRGFIQGKSDHLVTSPRTNKPSLQIAPNPVSTKAVIDIELTSDEQSQLNIYDINGQKITEIITTQPLAAGKHQEIVDCEMLPPGIYIVELIAGCERRIEKLIKY